MSNNNYQYDDGYVENYGSDSTQLLKYAAIGCLLLLIVVLLTNMFCGCNRNTKDTFSRVILRRMMSGTNRKGYEGGINKHCGRDFRGNEVGYLTNGVAEGWNIKPERRPMLPPPGEQEHTDDIAQDIADTTLNEITQQTGVDVTPDTSVIDTKSPKDIPATVNNNITPNGAKTYDTTSELNEDRAVETNVGKPVNGPIMEGFNNLRCNNAMLKSDFLTPMTESSSFGAKENFTPMSVAMRRYAKQFN